MVVNMSSDQAIIDSIEADHDWTLTAADFDRDNGDVPGFYEHLIPTAQAVWQTWAAQHPAEAEGYTLGPTEDFGWAIYAGDEDGESVTTIDLDVQERLGAAGSPYSVIYTPRMLAADVLSLISQFRTEVQSRLRDELLDKGQELADARDELAEAKDRAREAARTAVARGMTESETARLLGVTRLTVRSWLGK